MDIANHVTNVHSLDRTENSVHREFSTCFDRQQINIQDSFLMGGKLGTRETRWKKLIWPWNIKFWNKDSYLKKKIFTPKKPPVHLRWSWHWFSLTENFWTWLSETRSRGGARRAAQFFFWKPRKTWIFRFLARKAGKICSKFFIAFGRKKTLKNFAPKKRILTKFWKNIEKMLTKSGVFIVRFQFEWMNVSKSVGNS